MADNQVALLNDRSWPDMLWALLSNEMVKAAVLVVYIYIDTSTKAVKAILERPPTSIPVAAKEALKLCYDHFVPEADAPAPRRARKVARRDVNLFDDDEEEASNNNNNNDHENGNDNAGAGALSRNKTSSEDEGPGTDVTWEGWSTIFNMKKLKKPEFIFEHLAKLDSLPGAQALMTDITSETLQNGERLADYQDNEADLGMALRMRITLTFDVQKRSELDHVRQLFIYLMWYDMVMLVRPDLQSTRFGPVVRRELEPILLIAYSGEVPVDWMGRILAEVE
ncbi:hypothetical protein ABEF95_000791 [Exophiala dermatitidis]